MRCKSLLLSVAGMTVVFLLFVSQSLPGWAETSPQNACEPLAVARKTNAVDDNMRISLPGNFHPLARAEFDEGKVDDSLPMEHIMMMPPFLCEFRRAEPGWRIDATRQGNCELPETAP